VGSEIDVSSIQGQAEVKSESVCKLRSLVDRAYQAE
jgi:hypothetical protein